MPPPAEKGAAVQGIGRSRGGRGSKIHAVADDQGRIVAFAITAGQLGDARAAYGLLAPLPVAQRCLADGGYDSNDLRRFLVGRGSQLVIPNNPTRKHLHPFDPVAYRARNLIERAFYRLKDWRRLATRYAKLAANFASAVAIAAIVLW